MECGDEVANATDPNTMKADQKDATMKFNAIENAPYTLKQDFLTPIVLQHGILDSGKGMSTQAIELASHGYIVFSLDAMDGTCTYTERKDKSVVKTVFNNDAGCLEKFPNLWKDCLAIRVNCITKLLDEF